MNKHEAHAELIERICNHIRSMFNQHDDCYLADNDFTREVVKDAAENYKVNHDLLTKILFK